MSSATTAAPIVPADAPSLSRAGLLVLAFGTLDFGLESSIVLPGLPALAQHYSASLIAASWLATGFLLASVVAVPLFGRLGDLFGRRRLLLVGVGAFAVGSLVCALAESIGVVIAGRVMQGVGAAVGPLALGIARDALPPAMLTRGIGILVGAAGAGAAIGYLAGGVLIDQGSVSSIFWFLFVVSVGLFVAAAVLVPAPPPVHAPVPVDIAGAALIGAGLAALLLAVSKGNAWGWDSPGVVALLVGSGLLLAAFAFWERRVAHPLVDLDFVRGRPFAHANGCAFAVGFALALVVIVVPQIAALPAVTGYGLGYTPTQIGFLLLPMALSSIGAAWVGGRVVEVIGPRAVVAVGCAVAVAAYGLLIAAHTTAAAIATATGALGVALGLTVTGIASVVVHSAPLDKTSVAAAVNGIVRTTGSAVGAAVTAAVITGAGLVGPMPAEAGFSRSFAVGAIASACALIASLLLPRRG